MNELREKLELKDCKIVDKTWYPKDPEGSTVLVISSPLTVSIATALKCQNMAFNLNNEPNSFEGGFGLTHELADVELKLSGANGELLSLMPDIVKKFRIVHDAKENLMVLMRAHFFGNGYGDTLDQWCKTINTKAFDAVLVSLQGELFGDPVLVDGPAGGTRVDMSPRREDDKQERLISEEQAADTAEADGDGATLPPAVLAGGTHQRNSKRQRGRRGGGEILDAETEEIVN